MNAKPEGHGEKLSRFLEEEWNALATTRGAWCRSVGIAGSTVLRWSQGAEPDLKNLVVIAEGLGRNLVDILYAAGYIDESEVRVRTVTPARQRLDLESAIKTDKSLSDPERDALLAVHAAFTSITSARPPSPDAPSRP